MSNIVSYYFVGIVRGSAIFPREQVSPAKEVASAQSYLTVYLARRYFTTLAFENSEQYDVSHSSTYRYSFRSAIEVPSSRIN